MNYRILGIIVFITSGLYAQEPGKGHLNIGIGPEHHKAMAAFTNKLLANEYLLLVKTQNFHWNIVGSHFIGLHAFFGDQYIALQKIIDKIAERVRALGGHTLGSLHDFIEQGTIKENREAMVTEHAMVSMLLDDQEEIIRQIRAYIDFSVEHNDMGTNNMLCDLLEQHEKMAWMLRALKIQD